MIKLSPEAYKEVATEVINILSLGGIYTKDVLDSESEEFWFGGVKYVKDTSKLQRKVKSAPIVIDTTSGLYGKDVKLSVNGVIIDGITRINWNATPVGRHELDITVIGAKTKG